MYNIDIKLDAESLRCLQMIKGKKLQRVGYCFGVQASLATILDFGDQVIDVINDEIVIDDEAFAQLSFRENNGTSNFSNLFPVDTLNEATGEFEYRDYPMVIQNIELVHDNVTWSNNTIHSINIVVLSGLSKELVLIAPDIISETIDIRMNRSEIEPDRSIQQMWNYTDENDEPFPDMQFERIFERI